MKLIGHRKLLCLPSYVFPAVMLVIGAPTQQQLARPKPERCALKHIVHEEVLLMFGKRKKLPVICYDKSGKVPVIQ